MLQDAALFIFGFYILIKGSGILIDGASAIARKARVSEWLIGLTIVGIGTSIPELAVMLSASLVGETAIGLGTIIGSSTFNILFILGIAAVIYPLRLKKIWVRRELWWNIAAVAAVVAAVFWLGSTGELGISRLEGAVLLALFAVWLFIAARSDKNERGAEARMDKLIALPLSLVMVFGGILGVIFGGKWVVDSAASIAAALGFSQALIGLMIVGPGTSLPELAVTFTAAWRKQVGIAVGNIIGSNIFNFLGILGLAAMILPIPFITAMRFDMMITALATVMLLAITLINKKYVVGRWQGALLVFVYCAYIVSVALRENEL